MKIAVITPYYKETEQQLRQCAESVRAQTLPCDHVFVSDGHPSDVIDELGCKHIRAPNHGDYGDTPRLLGAAHVASAGYDALLFLDADNTFAPDHVETLVAFQRMAGVPVVTCGRTLVHCETGEAIGPCTESNGRDFVDTNCYLITRDAFPYCAGWGFKLPAQGIVGDRIFWNAMCRAGVKTAHSPRNGVNYVTTFAFHYLQNKVPVPSGAKVICDMGGGNLVMKSYTDVLGSNFRLNNV